MFHLSGMRGKYLDRSTPPEGPLTGVWPLFQKCKNPKSKIEKPKSRKVGKSKRRLSFSTGVYQPLTDVGAQVQHRLTLAQPQHALMEPRIVLAVYKGCEAQGEPITIYGDTSATIIRSKEGVFTISNVTGTDPEASEGVVYRLDGEGVATLGFYYKGKSSGDMGKFAGDEIPNWAFAQHTVGDSEATLYRHPISKEMTMDLGSAWTVGPYADAEKTSVRIYILSAAESAGAQAAAAAAASGLSNASSAWAKLLPKPGLSCSVCPTPARRRCRACHKGICSAECSDVHVC